MLGHGAEREPRRTKQQEVDITNIDEIDLVGRSVQSYAHRNRIKVEKGQPLPSLVVINYKIAEQPLAEGSLCPTDMCPQELTDTQQTSHTLELPEFGLEVQIRGLRGGTCGTCQAPFLSPQSHKVAFELDMIIKQGTVGFNNGIGPSLEEIKDLQTGPYNRDVWDE